MEENNTVQSYHEGACVYRGDGSLDYILHPEGVVRATGQGLSHEYFLKDHLGSTRVVFGSNGAVLQATDYYAFGLEHTPLAISNTNRYLYNGKELQDETFAGGVRLGWYDYGARFYDPQLGRFHTVDPLASKFPNWSPYVYCNNNPIIMVDPDGRSGEVVIDKQNRTVTVTSNLILYGSAGSAALAKSTAGDIQKQWNAAGGKVSIGGAEYSVNFVVNGSYNANLKESDVTGNKDIKNNYFKVVESGIDISYADGVGSNTGQFLLKNISADGSTTEAHEFGHGYGAVKGTADGHPVDKDLRGEGQPGMMNARGTIVDPQYQYDPKAKPGEKGGTINPDKRKVTQQDINYLNLDKLKYDKNGKANLGSLSNDYH